MIRQMALVTLLLAAALVVTGCKNRHEADNSGNKPLVSVKGVTLETIKSAAVPEKLDVVGTVRARTSAVVSARIPGIINLLRVREGDRVRKGQVLARLDAQENQSAAAAAAAGVDEAKRSLDEARARKSLANETFERFNKLYGEQAISRQEFDVKQTERELAVQGFGRAESRLKQAQESARAATTVAGHTRIVAPISGIIASQQASLGGTVFPSQPLMTIEDQGSYQLELAIPESMATKVKPGSAVQVTLDAIGSSFESKIAEIVPIADSGSRTFTAKINLNQNGLRSGLFGRGSIALGTTVSVLALPKQAIVERGALTSVWVLDEDNIARLRLIKCGRLVGKRVEILAGLSEGERVVVGGTEKVTEGAKIE